MNSVSKKAYLLVYSDQLTRNQVKECLNTMGLVDVWRFDLPNSFYFVSSNSAKELAKRFQEFIGEGHGQFLISEVTGNKEGWLPNASWHVLNEKKLKTDK